MPTYKKISDLSALATADSTDYILVEDRTNNNFLYITIGNLATSIVNTGNITFSGISSSGDSTTNLLNNDLYVNGYNIVSSSNGDIGLVPNGTGKVNIGDIASPVGLLHVYSGGSDVGAVDSTGNELVIQNNGDAGMTIVSNDGYKSSIIFATDDVPTGESKIWHQDSVLNVLSLGGIVVRETDSVNGLFFRNTTATNLANKNSSLITFQGTSLSDSVRSLAKIETKKASSATTDSGIFSLSVKDGSSWAEMLNISGNSMGIGGSANDDYTLTLGGNMSMGNNNISNVGTLSVNRITGSTPLLVSLNNNDIIAGSRAGTRNGIPTQLFDSAADSAKTYFGYMSDYYDNTGFTVRVHSAATDSGNLVWNLKLSAAGGTDSVGAVVDIDSDWYTYTDSVNDSASTVSGGVVVTEFTLNDSAQSGWIRAGNPFKLQLIRKGTAAADTVTGDVQVIAIAVVGS